MRNDFKDSDFKRESNFPGFWEEIITAAVFVASMWFMAWLFLF